MERCESVLVRRKEVKSGSNVEGDAVEGPVVCVSRVEVLQALNKMKTGKAPGHSEVSLELITVWGSRNSSDD